MQVIKINLKSCVWIRITKCTSIVWVMADWAAELQRSSWFMVNHRLNVCLHFHTDVKQ